MSTLKPYRSMICEAFVFSGVKFGLITCYLSPILNKDSSIFNYSKLPTRESYGQNPDCWDLLHYNSKNGGEKLVFELAKKHNIELVAVLPLAMLGSTTFSPSFDILKARTELGLNPKNSLQAVKEAIIYLHENQKYFICFSIL